MIGFIVVDVAVDKLGRILPKKISHGPPMRDRRALSLVGSVRAAVLSMSIVASPSRLAPSFRYDNSTHTLAARLSARRSPILTGHAEEQNLSETRRENPDRCLSSGCAHTLPDRLFQS